MEREAENLFVWPYILAHLIFREHITCNLGGTTWGSCIEGDFISVTYLVYGTIQLFVIWIE